MRASIEIELITVVYDVTVKFSQVTEGMREVEVLQWMITLAFASGSLYSSKVKQKISLVISSQSQSTVRRSYDQNSKKLAVKGEQHAHGFHPRTSASSIP